MINQLTLPHAIQCFLYDQLYPHTALPTTMINIALCPNPTGKVFVFHSTMARYYAPSDLSGIGGMHQQFIRSVPSWCHAAPQHDCVFVETDAALLGMRGLLVAQVFLFFKFSYYNIVYPCALVHWFKPVGNKPCPDTGMWIVKPEVGDNGKRVIFVIHLDTIVQGAHLIGVCGESFLPHNFNHTYSLFAFSLYYVNKFVDYHINALIA